MRTKTLALSAVLAMLGTASVMAQTNVYSLNSVGYINVSLPAQCFSFVACPLICSPDNTLNTIANNASGNLTGCVVTVITGGINPTYASDTAATVGTNAKKGQTPNTNGWLADGTLALSPGMSCWWDNPTSSNMSLTFVGTVPQGSLTNTIVPGVNLISSIVPVSGDLCTNSVTALTGYTVGDTLYMYDPTNKFAVGVPGSIGGTYATTSVTTGKGHGAGYHNNWEPGDPTTFAASQGFYYINSANHNYVWVENFSVNP
jgi:hypothetical protein